jgi:hypothetical protein
MRLLAALVIASLGVAAVPAQALECVVLNKPNQIGTGTEVPTQNGFMLVAYPANAKLPIKTIRLPDGSRVTGAVPGNIPLSFVYLDKTHTVNFVNPIAFQYVQQPDAMLGKVELYDAREALVYSGSVSSSWSYKVDTYFSPPFIPPVTKTVITFPKSLIVQFCVEPGASIGVSDRQWLRRRGRH